MNFYVMSLFPHLVTAALDDSIIGRAQSKKIIKINSFNIRDYTKDKHRRTDDYPYGGGLGMIMQAQPVFDCFTEVCRVAGKRPRLIYMSPHGKPLTQKKAHEIARYDDIAILCGHYEGIDRRIIDTIVDEEISIGDYILSGGELPAAVLIDSVSRLLEGTLKTSESYLEESFEHGLLEYPQYTRPEEYEGMRIPEVLLSGNQAEIDRWRRKESIVLTAKNRPDLLKKCELSAAEKRLFMKNVPEERAYFTITDGKLTVRVKRRGAELCSVVKNGTEYLWQGDEKYWNSQAPVLFPVVARSRNGVIRINGKDYPMPSHGFAKTRDFDVQAQSENSITLKIEDTPETREIYPFSFRFLITHTVSNGELTVSTRVENIGENKMWFTYGGHPGFNVPLHAGESFEDYEIELGESKDKTVPAMTKDMYIDFSNRRPVCDGDVLALNHELFANDALIFEKLHSCTLKSRVSGCGVRFETDENFNYLAFWTRYPAEAPYVCIEPWIGIGKCADETTLLRKRRGVLALKPGTEFSCKYKVIPIGAKKKHVQIESIKNGGILMTANKRPALVVMAAGLGSRFGGLKQLEPIGRNGEIILEYSVHDAIKAGFGRVVFIINKNIEAKFKERIASEIPSFIKRDFCIQDQNNVPSGVKIPSGRKKPWGTGHAVMSLKGVVSEPFAVINADDYYGAEAYRLLYKQLTGGEKGREKFSLCMVGYGVANTLSENGTVARGICDISADGYLKSVTERTKIMRRGDKICYTEDGESWIALPENSVASMNCWGFTADIIDALAEGFLRFFEKNAERLDTAEYFLPEFVSNLLKNGEARVKVLTASEGCYGVTYRDDVEKLRARIDGYTAEGKYVTPLWDDLR